MKRCCHIIANGLGTACAQLVTGDDFVIACDAGFMKARDVGIEPDLIVADFDSLDRSVLSDCHCELVELCWEKDDTDTLHALNLGLERGWREFVIHCALGGDVGHELANIHCLKHLDDCKAHGVLLGENQRLYLLSERHPQLEIHEAASTRISVFAFGGPVAGLSERGLHWELTDAILLPGDSFGVSNHVESDPALVSIKHGVLIVVVG